MNKGKWFIYLSMTLSFLYLIIFTWVPVLASLFLSFQSGRGNQLTFSGISNYSRIFLDDTFFTALYNTLLFSLIISPCVLLISIIIAYSIYKIRSDKIKRIVIVTVYLPSIISPITYAYFFRQFLSYDGFLNNILLSIGIQSESYNYLLTPTGARIAIILVCIWAWSGYYSVVILSALQNINPQLFKIAKIDGSNSWQIFKHILLPQIRPILIFSSILVLGNVIQLLAEVMIISSGGPEETTLTLAYYIYRLTFEYTPQFGYAAAITFVMFILITIVTEIQLIFGEKT